MTPFKTSTSCVFSAAASQGTKTSTYTIPEDGVYHVFAYAVSGQVNNLSSSSNSASLSISHSGNESATHTLKTLMNYKKNKQYSARIYYDTWNCYKNDTLSINHSSYSSDGNDGRNASGVFIMH